MLSEVMLLISIFVFLCVFYKIRFEKKKKQLKIREFIKRNIYKSYDKKHLNESPYCKYKHLNSPISSTPTKGNVIKTEYNSNSDVQLTPQKLFQSSKIDTNHFLYRNNLNNHEDSNIYSKVFDLYVDSNTNNLRNDYNQRKNYIKNQILNDVNKTTKYYTYNSLSDHRPLNINTKNNNENIVYACLLDENLNNDKRTNIIQIEDWSLSSHIRKSQVETIKIGRTNKNQIFKLPSFGERVEAGYENENFIKKEEREMEDELTNKRLSLSLSDYKIEDNEEKRYGSIGKILNLSCIEEDEMTDMKKIENANDDHNTKRRYISFESFGKKE